MFVLMDFISDDGELNSSFPWTGNYQK